MLRRTFLIVCKKTSCVFVWSANGSHRLRRRRVSNACTIYPPRRDVPRVPTRIYIIYGLSISLFKRHRKKIAAGRLRTQIRKQDKRMLNIIILYGRTTERERKDSGTWLETLNDRSIVSAMTVVVASAVWKSRHVIIVPFMNIVCEFKCRRRNNNCHRTPLFSYYRTTVMISFSTVFEISLILLFLIVTTENRLMCILCNAL